MMVPPTTLILRAWLSSFSFLAGIDIGKGFKIPWSSWSSDISIVLTAIPSATVDVYTPLRSRDMQVDVFGKPGGAVGAPVSSQRRATIPINQCGGIAETIVDQTTPYAYQLITLAGTSYLPVRLTDVLCSREPYIPPTDASGLGRVSMNLTVTYMAVYPD